MERENGRERCEHGKRCTCAMVQVWRQEDNFTDTVLSFHDYVGFKLTSVPLSHLTNPIKVY